MKILILIDSFTKSNGVSRVTEALAKEWLNSKNDVLILTKDCKEDFKNLKIKIIGNNTNTLDLIKNIIAIRLELNKNIFDYNPDIIVSNAGILGALINKEFKDKIIGIYHSIFINDLKYSFNESFISFVYNLFIFPFQFISIRKSKFALTPSKYASKINSLYFFKNFEVIPNGVDTKSLFRNKPINLGKKPIIFVGEICKRKGIIYLLKAFNIIKEKIPDSTLHIFGKISNKSLLKNLNDNTIIYHGVKSNIPDYIRGSELLLFPSLTENCSLVLLETQACGKPIVSFFNSGIPEVVSNNVTGFLVKNKNYQELAKKAIFVLKNKEVANKIGKKGIELSKGFTWEIRAKNYLDIFSNIKHKI